MGITLLCTSNIPRKYDPALFVPENASQYLSPKDDSKQLDEKGKQQIQQVVGSILYYGRLVDLTILMALSEIAGQ